MPRPLLSALHEEDCSFIRSQHVFFVASAPVEGRVNLSPKGMDTFRILSKRKVAYVDLTGSGNETAAHVLENGRLTVMFCSFDEQPLILRLSGRARVLHPDQPEFESTIGKFEALPGVRQIFLLSVDKVQKSCGFGVPFYEYRGERGQLIDWALSQGEQGLAEYRAQRNVRSIDGLPTNVLP